MSLIVTCLERLMTRILVSPNHLSHKVVIVEHISHNFAVISDHKPDNIKFYDGKEVVYQLVFTCRSTDSRSQHDRGA